ncbi:MAG TPA: hypothetical protein DCP91_00675 [Eggerthellaceae bacterium]|nr:hypothetical protein [Eggerthellaceae bacterium]
MEASQKSGFHYGYLIVLACVFICFGPCALVLSCAGIFFRPLSADLGIDPGMASYYLTALFAGSFISLPFSGKLFQTKDARVCISVSGALVAAVFFVQSFTMSLWFFIACGFVMGLAIPTLLYLAAPTLINRWFAKRAGFFIGIAMAFTGIGGVVFNPIGTYFITTVGWAFAYRVFAVIVLAMTLPFSLLVIRSYPADKGIEPFGADAYTGSKTENAASSAQSGMRAADAFKTKEFVLIFVWALLINICMYAYMVIATCVGGMQIEGVADALTFAGLAVSVAMVGQTLGKVVFGIVGDKDPRICIVVGLAAGVVGLLCYQFVPASHASIFVASFLVGLFASVTNVVLPIMTRSVFGTLEYSPIYARISMAASLGGIVMALIWGTLHTMMGNWSAMYIGEAVILAACIAIGLAVMASESKMKQRWMSAEQIEHDDAS